jgi:nucleoside-diphosphate-sugar epimerase
MRVFVTGATGFIGRHLVRELRAAGHDVTGLARSAEKGKALERHGARAAIGDLKDPSTYATVAAEHDAAVHAAMEYSAETLHADRAAIDTLLGASGAGGPLRHVVYTSGIWVLGSTGDTPAYEDAATDHPAALVAWRVEHEKRVLAAAGGDLATAVIRPGMVYGHEGSMIASYFASAQKSGAAQVVGDGANRIPMIHVDDLARLYRAILEHRAQGVFHAVDGHPVALLEVARAASSAAGKEGATRSLSLEEARQKMGPVADAVVLDQIVLTRRSAEVGWEPRRGPFLDEVGRAFEEWQQARS